MSRRLSSPANSLPPMTGYPYTPWTGWKTTYCPPWWLIGCPQTTGFNSFSASSPCDFHHGSRQGVPIDELPSPGMLKKAIPYCLWEVKQVAFCPYCGVLNENANTAFSHVRKHLDLMFLCGGCQTKSFQNGQVFYKHMKDNCPAILAIQKKTRGAKK